MDCTTTIGIILSIVLLFGIVIYFINKNETHKKENKIVQDLNENKVDPKTGEFHLKGGKEMYQNSDFFLPVQRNKLTSTESTNTNNSTSDDGFLTSMLVAEATDSALIGTMVGGNPLGAMIGDSLNDNDSHNSSNDWTPSDYSSSSDSSSYDSSSDYSSSDSTSSSDF